MKTMCLCLIAELACVIGLVARGDDDGDTTNIYYDDDSEDGDSSDDNPDDDSDDDSGGSATCEEAMDYMYNECGLSFGDVSMEDAAAGCRIHRETGDEQYAAYECPVTCFDAGDCNDFVICVETCVP